MNEKEIATSHFANTLITLEFKLWALLYSKHTFSQFLDPFSFGEAMVQCRKTQVYEAGTEHSGVLGSTCFLCFGTGESGWADT